MSTVLSIIAIVVSAVSACAVVGSWRVARRAQHDAARVRQIEQDRRHDELAPAFEFTVTLTGNANDSADLDVKFVGGPDHLDEVVFTILDEAGQDHWARGLPDRLTPEVAEQFIWGPWEFNTAAREQIADLRRSKPRGYSRSNGNDWDRLPLVRTRAGFWMSGMTAE